MGKQRYTHQQQMHLWKRQIDQQDRLARDFQRDREQADIAVEKAEERAEALLEKARNDAQAAAAKTRAEYAAEEKKLLTSSRTVYRGATVGQPSIWVTHAKAAMPETLMRDLGADAGTAHRFLRLRAGGGISVGDVAPAVIAASRPEVVNDRDFKRWTEALKPLVADAQLRYPILGKLRNDGWMAELLGSVGVLPSPHVVDAERVGTYGRYPYKLSVQDVPSLTSVSITRTGLALVLSHIAGMSAKDWNVRIDKLRATLGNAGMNARDMTVTDGPDGSVVLRFGDLDPFSDMTEGTIVPYDAEHGRSYVGQSADGGEVWLTLKNNALGLIAGMQGGGKTASMLPVLAALVGHAELHLLDGNSSGEWSALRPICATYDESGEITALADLIESLFPVARERLQRISGATGDINFWDVPAQRREALGLYPIVVAVEEAPQYLSKNQLDKEMKAAAERNMVSVGKAVKLFRKAGITVLLIVQKPVADEIPTVVRDMAGGRLCFRLDSDTAAATVLGDAAYQEPKPSTIPPGKPGRFVARVDARGNVLGQAPYVPIGVIRESLAGATPVPDQRAAAHPAKPADVAEDLDEEIAEAVEESPATPELTDEELLAEMRRRGLAPTEPVAEKATSKPRKTAPRKDAASASAPESTPAPTSDTEGW